MSGGYPSGNSERDQGMSGGRGMGSGSSVVYGASGRSYGQDYGQSMSGGQGHGSSGRGGQAGMGQSGMGQSGMGGHRGKGPMGYQRSDDRVREMVNDTLEDEDHVDASNIEVKVEQGEVTLTGTVTDRQQKRRAEECVEHLRGVRDVHNQLRVQQGGMGQPSMGSQSGMSQSGMSQSGMSQSGMGSQTGSSQSSMGSQSGGTGMGGSTTGGTVDRTGSAGTGSTGEGTPMGSLGSGANKDGGSGR
jgi:hypothetical protein